MIGMIAAVSSNGVIGIKKDDKWDLPFKYNEDMKHFKNLTKDSVVIMGRKTFESIGKPLPHRENIVITSRNLEISGVSCFASVQGAMNYQSIILRDRATNIWFIGGASIYEEGLMYADEIHLTITPDVIKKDDVVRFPWINPLKYRISSVSKLNPESKLDYVIYSTK